MAKQNEALFEESSRGAVSAVTVITLIVSVILAFGGLVLMGYGFMPGSDDTAHILLFSGGLIATFLGFALPFNLLPSTGK